jgi:hypothetical protein
VAEQGIGDRAPFLPAHPVDEIEHEPAGEVAPVLHRRALDDSPALVTPSGEGLPIEQRRHHEQAKPIRERARVIAVGAGVAGDAVKDHEQRRIGTSHRTVGEDHHGRAVHIGDLSAGFDRGSPERHGTEQRAQHRSRSRNACYPIHLMFSRGRYSQNRHDCGLKHHSSDNGVPHGKAHALSRRPVAVVDHAMDA